MRRSHIVGRRGAAVANFYDRDAYGNIGSSIEGVAQRVTYAGSEFDAESGLYYYRACYYDPATGRLLAVGLGANPRRGRDRENAVSRPCPRRPRIFSLPAHC